MRRHHHHHHSSDNSRVSMVGQNDLQEGSDVHVRFTDESAAPTHPFDDPLEQGIFYGASWEGFDRLSADPERSRSHRLHAEHVENPTQCQNPQCGTVTQNLERAQIPGIAESLYLCPQCHHYARIYRGLRPVQTARDTPVQVLCSNPNCRAPVLAQPGVDPSSWYCERCFVYMQRNGGRQRPRQDVVVDEEIAKALAAGVSRCGVPNCGLVTEDRGQRVLYACPRCSAYCNRNEQLRVVLRIDEVRTL